MFVNDPLLVAAANAAYKGRRRFVDRTNAELARFVKRATGNERKSRESVALVVGEGNPADEILAQAKHLRSDLIVMGSHGLSGLQKAFFGSTTEQVLRKSKVPVLAIPPSVRARNQTAVPTDITRVIAPIDLAGEWQSDAMRAAQIAGDFEAPLVLVHVLAPVQTPPWLRRRRDTNNRRIEKATKSLERVRTKLFADLRSMSTKVLLGDPAHEIARLTHPGSLVVMSLRGTAGVWGMRRGSVAYHVLTHALTPVLALPRRRIGGRFSARARRAINENLTARDRAEMAGIDALLSLGSGRKRVER
jgi:nucleotide-binding universal stress UspA family protein